MVEERVKQKEFCGLQSLSNDVRASRSTVQPSETDVAHCDCGLQNGASIVNSIDTGRPISGDTGARILTADKTIVELLSVVFAL